MGFVCVGAMSAFACNGDYDFSSDDSDDGGPSGATSGAGGTNGFVGSGPTNGSNGAQTTQSMGPVDGVFITSLALYQGVKRTLMDNGNPVSQGVPLIAGREGVLRVFYTTDGSYNGQPVTARLSLDGQDPIEIQATPSGVSSDGSMSSTINIPIDGSALSGTTGYRVDLLQPEELTSGGNGAATYPLEGTDQLPLQSAGAQLRIVLLPIAYGADGSNRLPDTSAAQVERYRDAFYKMYPVPEVEIEVDDPIQWNSTVSAFGQGWNGLLDHVVNYRQSSGAAADEYYYGIFAPASSFSSFCGQGCVSGLSLLGQSPGDSWARAGIGVGFTGPDSADTAAHEVGHQHGRGHAPCGANQGIDSGFPYSDGMINSWGYDLTTQELVSPSQYADFMSYCNPTFVSDYSFQQLFNRIKAVNGASFEIPETLKHAEYERITIGPDGEVQWHEAIELDTPPFGQLTTLTVEDEEGETEVTGHFYPYSHIDGGMLVFAKSPTHLITHLAFELDGEVFSLAR